MTEFNMVAFLWDQVKKLSEKVRQHSGEVQVGYSEMCKLENSGMIPHLRKEEPVMIPTIDTSGNPSEMPLEIPNETIVEEPLPVPIEEEPIPDPSIEEMVVKLTEDNIDALLEKYKLKLLAKKDE